MGIGTGLASAQLTLLSRLSTTGGATNCQGLFLFGFHGYIMQTCSRTRCSIVTTESRHAETLDRGASHSATDVRSKNQFKYGDVGKFNLVCLDLPDGLRWAKVPLLTDNFSKRAPAVRRPSQNELLRTGCFVFLKNECYASQLLRMVEDQPNRLSSRDGRAPTPSFSWYQRSLYWEIFLFRRDLDRGCT